MGLLRIDHVGVAVEDTREATRVLTDTLGLSVLGESMELPDQRVEVQFTEVGGDKIEVLAPTNEASQLTRFLQRRGEGLHHICFEVDDIGAELNRLAHRDVALVDREPWLSPHGWAAFIHPRWWRGVSIELRQF